MKDIWVKFACFLIGYNYDLVRSSSEATAKAVKKYISAMLIISTLWFFIGYSFAERYLRTNPFESILGGLIMVIMVIQIERQIILTVGKVKFAIFFRVLIGIIMSVIGSVILDQIIFKDDIEKFKINNLQNEVSTILPLKTKELSRQIQELKNFIVVRETERAALLEEITKKPTILMPSSSSASVEDSTGRVLQRNRTNTLMSIPNPKIDLIPKIDEQIKLLNKKVQEKENEILESRSKLELEIASKVGFIDELKSLFSLLFTSPVALIIWILIFVFFLSIELFILVIKYADGENDYDKRVNHQVNLRKRMIDLSNEKYHS
jgi:hypothetical protein